MNLEIETVGRIFAENMSSHAKIVYLALVYHANVTSGKAWPSRARIANETGLGVTTVSKAIGELCRRAFIVCHKSQSGNSYELHLMNVPCTSGVLPTNATCTSDEREASFGRTPHVLPTNATCTSDEREAFTEHKKEHKKELKKEHKQEHPPYPPCGEGEKAFEVFWQAYPPSCPRKVDKAKCRAKYLKLRGETPNPTAFDAALLEALERWKASDLWTNDGGKYIRAPLVWLNSRSWEDTPLPAKQDTAGTFRTAGYKLRLGMAQVA